MNNKAGYLTIMLLNISTIFGSNAKFTLDSHCSILSMAEALTSILYTIRNILSTHVYFCTM